MTINNPKLNMNDLASPAYILRMLKPNRLKNIGSQYN